MDKLKEIYHGETGFFVPSINVFAIKIVNLEALRQISTYQRDFRLIDDLVGSAKT